MRSKKISYYILLLSMFLVNATVLQAQVKTRTTEPFNSNWKFYLGNDTTAKNSNYNDAAWRSLQLPHDWSIELPFDSTSPTGIGGGALRGGIGWYRKTFTLPATATNKNIFINFDGVYCNSEVWINGFYLGMRPYGYSSFQYNLTPYVNFGTQKNVIAVKVNNDQQPNSRWYSGSGIYRNVWLVTTNEIFIDHWGTYITTPKINTATAQVQISTTVRNVNATKEKVTLTTTVYDAVGKLVQTATRDANLNEEVTTVKQELQIGLPKLWSDVNPYLYKAITVISNKEKKIDEYSTTFGIRSFEFDVNKGFLLNGKPVKINGVCNHHDLGCLGAAINTRALERQLQILKNIGCNGIRTSHNPPAPELLDLCDKMGFIVMDEAFDMWKMQKNVYDYHLHWDAWHKRDLEDMILRDRNHPSVFIWSIGNEIPEQSDSAETGVLIAKELADIVKTLDSTRPITAACDRPGKENNIIKSNALDLIGYNYHQYMYADFQQLFPGKKFISTESVSGMATRGHYDLIPSDSIRRWPERWDKPLDNGNKDYTISAYDHVSAPWGSTHEETWKIMKKYNFLSGQYIWTGFDYLGEPTPYLWPARSSYLGIVDLAGFPKDVYYMYQSEWTNKTVLHIFPHWNWNKGDTVDVWAYYSNADEVELFLNGKSVGTRKKQGDDLHVKWRLPYVAGSIKAISKKEGKPMLVKEIKTAGKPAKIILIADRNSINANGNDLSFITVQIVDENGTIVPSANNQVKFNVSGPGFLRAVDNGSQISMEPFKANERKAFNGLCLAVIQANKNKGIIQVKATADQLATATLEVNVK